MPPRSSAPESDLQRLLRAARDGDPAALLPLSDAFEEAGDVATADAARRLAALLAGWHSHLAAGAGPPARLTNVMLLADGSWSLAQLCDGGPAGQPRSHAVSFTFSPAPEPAVAELLQRFDQLHPLVECAARSLGLTAVELRGGASGRARAAALGDGKHLAPAAGHPVTSALLSRE